jgi:hypothetical protein
VGGVDLMSRFRGLAVVALMLVMESSSAQAQSSSKIPRIGYMSADSGPNVLSTAFLTALGELGWEEGLNVVIEYRWAQGRPEDPQRREACRSARRAADQIRSGDQSWDGKGARAHARAVSTRPCERDDPKCSGDARAERPVGMDGSYG